MITRVITFLARTKTLLTPTVSAMCFHIEEMFIFMAMNSHFEGWDDNKNLTLAIMSYEIYETRQRLFS